MTRRLRPLVGVLAAIAVAETGTRVSAIAIPWLVLVTTGSATKTGLVAFCELAPYVVVKALTGPLIDRFGPRRVSWRTDLVSGAAAASVALSPVLPFWLLLPLVAVVGAARGPGDQAKEVMIFEATRDSGVLLERVTGLAGVIERLAATLGPAVGGVLIAVFSPSLGLLATAVCFVAGSVIVGLVLPRGLGSAVAEPLGYGRSLVEGFEFLRRQPMLLTIFGMVSATNLLDQAFTVVLLPVWARMSGGGPAVIGLTGSVRGLASIAGSVVATTAAHRLKRRLVFFTGFLVAGAPRFWILAGHVPLWTVLAVFVVSGFGAGFLNPILGAIPYELVPQRLMGRVLSMGQALGWAGIPLGGLIAGAAVAATGLAPVLLAGGGIYAAVTCIAGLRPEWRSLDRPRVTASTSAEPGSPTPASRSDG
ncbi:MAG TPA: MFS transporter [Pseudonocardiaceae bacterium]|nr:MFS transporter [Pseudonocardiaceae bacterium]